ncbi:4Fe-4S binding protein [Poseidonibacter antarcticus]|uniref:4Fe-4S binding protein n=1 Tax=Poseidonibacter antarcticus TaxID=2478538 RepID=UPI000EF4E5EE|nr:4Fe-4S binding protein [Poseidonibacter antarcticus]
MFRLFLIIFILFMSLTNINASMSKEQISNYIKNPMHLGKKDDKLPVWEVLDENNELHSYIFESFDYAPIAGFSGGKMNLLIRIDLEGNFLDVEVLDQDEPVFVSGLGIEPFIKFLKQYKGKSLKNSIKVGTSKDQTSSVHIDGVTKATASVKIANDIILGSAVQVAKTKLMGIAPKEIHHPKEDLFEKYTWNELLENKLITHIKVTKEQIENLFKGSDYILDLTDKEKNEIALDLYIADLSIPSVAKNLIKTSTQNEISDELRKTDEAILIFANGEFKFLTEKFIPRSSPDELGILQDGFNLNIRDGDYIIEFLDNIPKFEQSIILEVDKRYDFDPSSLWTLNIKTARGTDSIFLTPLAGYLSFDIEPIKKYFNIIKKEKETPLWLTSIYEQKVKLITLTLFLSFLFIMLYKYQTLLTKLRYKRTILLTFTLFFIGWYGQGQLSMVTVLGVVKAIVNSQSLMFLLYDPFSLIIWFFVFVSLAIWGRGTFCGWLCPYGTLQEFSHYLGRLLKLPRIRVSESLNNKLVYIKYVVLAALILSVIFAPNISEYLIEIEPFKTSITLIFDREIPYVLYALFWLFLGMFLFKGFCRYFCPLGAFLSLMGRLKILDWLPRRAECGNPCNNCHKSCNYQAIDKKSGAIKYADCFQCLDCVQIYSDANLCKILKKDAKKEKDMLIKEWRKTNG